MHVPVASSAVKAYPVSSGTLADCGCLIWLWLRGRIGLVLPAAGLALHAALNYSMSTAQPEFQVVQPARRPWRPTKVLPGTAALHVRPARSSIGSVLAEELHQDRALPLFTATPVSLGPTLLTPDLNEAVLNVSSGQDQDRHGSRPMLRSL